MIKKIVLFLCVFTVSFIFCSCGIRPPTEKELLLMVPAEVFQYEFDGITYHSEVKSFEITKRQTDEKRILQYAS